MYYAGTSASAAPDFVIVENFSDGHQVVRLADHIHEEPIEGGTSYVYDEVVFDMPSDRHATVESIAEAFEGWWEYGRREQEAITLEQRVSDLEEIILGMMEG